MSVFHHCLSRRLARRSSSSSSRSSQVDSHKDRATFVHLYGAEPHPLPPATNFDIGTQRPQYWSVVDQHRTYDERVAMAKTIRRMVHPAEVSDAPLF